MIEVLGREETFVVLIFVGRRIFIVVVLVSVLALGEDLLLVLVLELLLN